MTDYYQDGYDKGYKDGCAGRYSEHPGHWLDFINTSNQQEYEDGYEAGYKEGEENRLREGGENEEE